MILSLPSVCPVLLEFKTGLIGLCSSFSVLLPCLPIFIFSSEPEEVAHTDLPNDCFGFRQHLIHCLASANLDILMILFAFPAHNISRSHSSTAGEMFVLLSLAFLWNDVRFLEKVQRCSGGFPLILRLFPLAFAPCNVVWILCSLFENEILKTLHMFLQENVCRDYVELGIVLPPNIH